MDETWLALGPEGPARPRCDPPHRTCPRSPLRSATSVTHPRHRPGPEHRRPRAAVVRRPHASGRGRPATAFPDTVPSGEDPGRWQQRSSRDLAVSVVRRRPVRRAAPSSPRDEREIHMKHDDVRIRGHRYDRGILTAAAAAAAATAVATAVATATATAASAADATADRHRRPPRRPPTRRPPQGPTKSTRSRPCATTAGWSARAGCSSTRRSTWSRRSGTSTCERRSRPPPWCSGPHRRHSSPSGRHPADHLPGVRLVAGPTDDRPGLPQPRRPCLRLHGGERLRRRPHDPAAAVGRARAGASAGVDPPPAAFVLRLRELAAQHRADGLDRDEMRALLRREFPDQSPGP